MGTVLKYERPDEVDAADLQRPAGGTGEVVIFPGIYVERYKEAGAQTGTGGPDSTRLPHPTPRPTDAEGG